MTKRTNLVNIGASKAASRAAQNLYVPTRSLKKTRTTASSHAGLAVRQIFKNTTSKS